MALMMQDNYQMPLFDHLQGDMRTMTENEAGGTYWRSCEKQ